MNMQYVLIFQAALVIAYLAYVTYKFGILWSISESYYKLGKGGYKFSLFLCLLGTTLFPFEHGLFFFSGAGLIFTAVAAQYRERLTDIVHYVGAASSILLACAGLVVHGHWEISVFVVSGAIILYNLLTKNILFWVEVSSIAFIHFGLWMVIK